MGRADWERAWREYPSTQWGRDEIDAFLRANPEVIWRIVGDMYEAVKQEEERRAGVKPKMGRRPVRKNVPLEEVWRVIFAQPFTLEPFPVAMRELMQGASQRAFTAKLPLNQSTLSRLLSGELQPDMPMMEILAEACGVQPVYFVEYRAQYVGAMIADTFVKNPRLGIKAIKEVARAS